MSYLREILRRARAALRTGRWWPTIVRAIGEPAFLLVGRRWRRNRCSLAGARAILVVRLDEIGDLVMSSAFLRELRRNAPQAWIALVVKPALRNLVEKCPYVNELFTFDREVSGHAPLARLHGRALALACRRLWRRQIDLALLPRADADFYHGAFVAYFSAAPARVGYSQRGHTVRPWHGMDYDALLTNALDCPRELHEVERSLHMLRLLGGRVVEDSLEVWLTDADRNAASGLLAAGGLKPGETLVGIGPGAGVPARAWPVQRYIALARYLLEKPGFRVVLLGGTEDLEAASSMAAAIGPRAIQCAGRTTLREAAAVLSHCRVFIGNDSGPAHLAAAVGTAVIVISPHAKDAAPFTANCPSRFRPWGVPHRILRPERLMNPCRERCTAAYPHCILGVSVEQVCEGVESLLQELCSSARASSPGDRPPGA